MKTLVVSSWIQKTNRALERAANICLPNKILFYEVRKKLILKVIVGYLWSLLVCIQGDVILNSSIYISVLEIFCIRLDLSYQRHLKYLIIQYS